MTEPDDFISVDMAAPKPVPLPAPSSPPPPPSAPQPPALGMLGRYKLLHSLGKGGMAEVFLAVQDGPAGFSKQVVVKRSDPELAKNPRFVEMFLREAKIAARLNHTNVVQVFELGQQGETYFIAMEHIDGISLQKAARRAWSIGESIPMEVIVKCVADAARGLHYAHSLKYPDGRDGGLVHRDISPDNLMVTRDGVTKVLDFGIAKMEVDEVDAVTQTGELKGKIPFMPPEQLKGDPLDGRADLWSLGVTLYWLLTGTRPFVGNEIQTLQAILHDAPISPRAVNPLVPIPLDRLTMRLLEKDRTRRYASGQEVADALMSLLGPGLSSNAAAEFAVRMIGLQDPQRPLHVGTQGASQSVQTVIAAKPQTEWLMKAAPSDSPSQELWRSGIAGEIIKPVGDRPPMPESRDGALVVAAARSSKRGLLIGVGAGALFAIVITGVFLALREPPPALPPVAVTTTPLLVDTPPVVVTPPPVVPVVPVDTIVTPPVEATITPTPTPALTTATAKRTATSAPAAIRWETSKGKLLGKGNSGIVVADGASSVVAVDPVTGGRSVVRVVAGALDYGSLKSGRLVVRAQPFADVRLGTKILGTTPFQPLSLVEGSYTVELMHEGKVIKRAVTVSGGKEAVVAVNMLKE